ncbi:hypothetical protein EG329_009360 [Mollisiaceae sp. DMI_Dod_QoI]|nr:hypothetical protein EG329_009360 [Helotiales sp. DMI_Dod_QoI]
MQELTCDEIGRFVIASIPTNLAPSPSTMAFVHRNLGPDDLMRRFTNLESRFAGPKPKCSPSKTHPPRRTYIPPIETRGQRAQEDLVTGDCYNSPVRRERVSIQVAQVTQVYQTPQRRVQGLPAPSRPHKKRLRDRSGQERITRGSRAQVHRPQARSTRKNYNQNQTPVSRRSSPTFPDPGIQDRVAQDHHIQAHRIQHLLATAHRAQALRLQPYVNLSTMSVDMASTKGKEPDLASNTSDTRIIMATTNGKQPELTPRASKLPVPLSKISTPKSGRTATTPRSTVGHSGLESSRSTLPKPRSHRQSTGISSLAYGNANGLHLNKELPPKPSAIPIPARRSTVQGFSHVYQGIPVTTTTERSDRKVSFSDSDSVLGMTDEQRRAKKFGVGPPTVRFSKDAKSVIMGSGSVKGKEKRKSSKSQDEIAAQLRSNRTSDSTLASRLAHPTNASDSQATESMVEIERNRLKSRVSAIFHGRRHSSRAAVPAPAVASTPAVVPASTIVPTPAVAPSPAVVQSVANPPVTTQSVASNAGVTPQSDLLASLAKVRDADQLYEDGLHLLAGIVEEFRVKALAAAAHTQPAQLNRLTARIQTVVNSVVDLNQSRMARIRALNSLEQIAVEEVIATAGAITQVKGMIDEI